VEVAASLPAQASVHWCAISRWDFVAAAIRVAIVDGVAFINRMRPRRWV
jgi:arginine N-succinyltransferase